MSGTADADCFIVVVARSFPLEYEASTRGCAEEILEICRQRQARGSPVYKLELIRITNLTAQEVESLKSVVAVVNWDGVEEDDLFPGEMLMFLIALQRDLD